ncbi:hypothetical protein Hanom_Chr14g01248271 [Helianthus anomalus]
MGSAGMSSEFGVYSSEEFDSNPNLDGSSSHCMGNPPVASVPVDDINEQVHDMHGKLDSHAVENNDE